MPSSKENIVRSSYWWFLFKLRWVRHIWNFISNSFRKENCWYRSKALPEIVIISYMHRHYRIESSLKYSQETVQRIFKKYLFTKHGLMVVDSGTWGQLWYHSLKRAERESKNKVSSTVNRYVFCFINARFVGLFSVKFSPDRVSFPFSAQILFPSLFTVPLMRMTDLLSRLEFLN